MKIRLKKSLALFLSLLICLNTSLVLAEEDIKANLEGQVELEKEERPVEAKKEETGEASKEDLANEDTEDIREEVENRKDKEEDDLGGEIEETKEGEAEPNRDEIQLEEDRKTEEEVKIVEEKEVEDLDIDKLDDPEEELKLEGKDLASEDEHENFDLEWFEYDKKDGCIILKKLNDDFKKQETIEIPGTIMKDGNEYKIKILGTSGESENAIGFFPSFKYSELKYLKVGSQDKKVKVEGNSLSYSFYNNDDIENIDLSGIDTSNVKDMSYMFSWCGSLKNLNLSNFNTRNVENMEGMFEYCSVESLNLKSFDTSRVTNMEGMFNVCGVKELDLSNFNTLNVTNMKYMFNGSNLESLDLGNFNTSKVENMIGMFKDSRDLKELNLSSFNTENVVDMTEMFRNCEELIDLKLGDKFNTLNVETMDSIFDGCESLVDLDLSNFNTRNVKTMDAMFTDCCSLVELDLSNFNTLNVEDMGYMFAGCKSLVKLDLSNFDTSNVKFMERMFDGCKNLVDLDLSNFDTSNVKYMNEMFMLDEDNGVEELLLIGDDKNLLEYNYEDDNRIPREMKFKITIDSGEGRFKNESESSSKSLYEFENSKNGENWKVAYSNEDLEFSKEKYDEFFQANSLVANKSNEELVGFKDTIGEEYTLLGLKDHLFKGKDHINVLDFVWDEEERTYTAIYKRSTNNGSDRPTRPDKDKPGENKPEEKPDKPEEKPNDNIVPQKPSTPEEQDKVDRYKGGDRSEREDLIGMIIEDQIDYELNKTDHLAYLKGYNDNTVRPEGNVTREEAAMVFYRLMEPEFRKEVETEDQDFTDVENGRWSEKAIATLAKAEMITGYKDGSFKPTKEITRAEVSSMIGKLTDTIILPTDFKDIVEHWAEDYINSVGREGWIKGYEDGSFRPNDLIKRSEFVTIVNSILERQVKKENILEGIKAFKDLGENKWYYEQVIEATNGHKYVIKDGEEVWTEIIK